MNKKDNFYRRINIRDSIIPMKTMTIDDFRISRKLKIKRYKRNLIIAFNEARLNDHQITLNNTLEKQLLWMSLSLSLDFSFLNEDLVNGIINSVKPVFGGNNTRWF